MTYEEKCETRARTEQETRLLPKQGRQVEYARNVHKPPIATRDGDYHDKCRLHRQVRFYWRAPGHAGDMARGASLVVRAIADGLAVADGIGRWLAGRAAG